MVVLNSLDRLRWSHWHHRIFAIHMCEWITLDTNFQPVKVSSLDQKMIKMKLIVLLYFTCFHGVSMDPRFQAPSIFSVKWLMSSSIEWPKEILSPIDGMVKSYISNFYMAAYTAIEHRQVCKSHGSIEEPCGYHCLCEPRSGKVICWHQGYSVPQMLLT